MNKKRNLMFNNDLFDFTEVRTGIPQGSILGSLLFNGITKINYFLKVSYKLNFITYADYTTLYFDLEDFENDNLEYQVND